MVIQLVQTFISIIYACKYKFLSWVPEVNAFIFIQQYPNELKFILEDITEEDYLNDFKCKIDKNCIECINKMLINLRDTIALSKSLSNIYYWCEKVIKLINGSYEKEPTISENILKIIEKSKKDFMEQLDQVYHKCNYFLKIK